MFFLTPPRHISTLPFASVWLSVDDFRSPPKADILRIGRHVSNVPIGELRPVYMNEAADWGNFGSTVMLVILAFIVIVIAIYEIVARERDCRWISPDFIERRGR